jgi:hypothetical protein
MFGTEGVELVRVTPPPLDRPSSMLPFQG